MNLQIFVTNLGYNRDGFEHISIASQSTNQDENECYSSNSEERIEKMVGIKPALGAYWESVAHHKVLMDFVDHPHDINADTSELIERQISLLSSKHFESTTGKLLHITNIGVS